MLDSQSFRHLGGGRKGLFLLLRYVFIASASYLVIFQRNDWSVAPSHGLMIAVALASNVGLSLVKADFIFSWYVEAPILVADTLWVSWALHSSGAPGQDLFLLYFFVLFLAALGDSLVIVLLGSTSVSIANLYFTAAPGEIWTSPHLLRIAFFYSVALFYGYVIGQIKRERQRADKGFAWAKELEAKVAERTAQLTRLYHESRETSRLKSEFLANMSHELRTPLHIIVGYTELLLDPSTEPPPPERTNMIRRIGEAAADQLQLVESVLDLGKVEVGRMPVVRQPLRLDRFLAELQQRPRIPLAPGVALQWQMAEHANLVIETDHAKLGVILNNLIDNAIKFTAAGTITVAVRNDPGREEIQFTVADTGPGIADDDLPKIFEAFRQLDGSLSRRHGGVGLGLTIVSKYVDLLGGAVSVRSSLGTGTEFIVTLPHRARADRPVAEDAPLPAAHRPAIIAPAVTR